MCYSVGQKMRIQLRLEGWVRRTILVRLFVMNDEKLSELTDHLISTLILIKTELCHNSEIRIAGILHCYFWQSYLLFIGGLAQLVATFTRSTKLLYAEPG